jgi:hypothetical protein
MTEKPRGRPPERITVEVRFKQALSTPPVLEAITWPKGWPLPEQGDQITIGDLNGVVNNRTFYPALGKLAVNCR